MPKLTLLGYSASSKNECGTGPDAPPRVKALVTMAPGRLALARSPPGA